MMRSYLTTGGTRSRIVDPETGQVKELPYKETDYEVSSTPRFRRSTIVRRVSSPKTFVKDPHGRGASLAVYGQVDVKTNYGIRAEFRTIRLDRSDHPNLYRSYLNQR